MGPTSIVCWSKTAGAAGTGNTRQAIRVLEGLEKEAREGKKGLWVDLAPVPPWEWRGEASERRIVGRLFPPPHLPSPHATIDQVDLKK